MLKEPSCSTEMLAEHVGQEGGRLVLLSVSRDFSSVFLNPFRDTVLAAKGFKLSIPLTLFYVLCMSGGLLPGETSMQS